MEFPGKHGEQNDSLDEILRRYLLENDPETAEGESILELAGERIMTNPPMSIPSDAAEAEMLKRLKDGFPQGPAHAVPAAPAGSPIALKIGFVGVGALAVLTTLILLITNPFADRNNIYSEQLKHEASPDLNTLADQVGVQPRVESALTLEDITSLQLEDGGSVMLVEEDLPDRNSEGGRVPTLTYGTPSRSPKQRPEDKVPAPLTSSSKVTVVPPMAHPAMVEEPAPDPFPLRALYTQTTTTSDYYQFDAHNDHLVEGKKGTVMHIPRDAFVTQAGERVRGKIQLEIKEVYQKSDYIKSNLPTISNGRQLISGGVLYLEASAEGRPLKLARDKDIYVEFAALEGVDTRDMQLWQGEYSAQGDMNWVPVGGEFDRMIPMPLDELYFDEFWCDCKGEKLWNRTLWEITDPEFADTWIASREFRHRLRVLRDIGYYEQGLLYYRDHVNEPLWKVDQAVAGLLVAEAREGRGKEDDASYFERFSQELLTFTEPFDDRGVDLGRWDARRQLLYRRVSREETERLLRLHHLRRRFVGDLEGRLYLAENNGSKYVKGIRPGKYRSPGTETVKGFLVKELGWVNLDKVADPVFAGNASRKVKVRLTGEVPLDARITPFEPVNTFLVYSDINSVIPGSLITGQYSTFKDVPPNMDGWVVALGYKGAVPYIGISRLSRESRNLVVEMRPTTIDDYLQQLKRLDA